MAGILVVEDEVVVAMDIQASLARLGYEVLGTAASADEALAHAHKRVPDLALVDIHIKGDKDGIETAELLKRQFDTPIVYLTAFADDETVARAKTTQPYGYVVKPFSPKELKSAVEIALYKHALEAQLREREHWFSTTLRSIGDGVIAVDPLGKVSFMNVVAEDLTGAREEQVKGRALTDVFRIVDEDTRADIADPVARAIREGRVVDLPPNSLLLPRAGDARPIEDSAAPIVDDSGNLLGAVIVFRDVSDRRRLQQQIVMADRFASLGTLAAGVGHEINNPLAVIVANLAFLDQEVQDLEKDPEGTAARMEELKRIVRELREEADRIRRIVGDLKVFARPPDERRLPLDPIECLDWALRVTGNQTHHKAKVVRSVQPVPLVDANASQLGQVFVNLLVNAAHSIPDRAADHHEIRVNAETDPEGRVAISIADTGPGLTPDKLKRIFDPFTANRVTGAGLGLSICHGLVRAMGGEIKAESTPGSGTIFTVKLPASRTERKAPTPPPPAPAPRVRGRVLVIDDEPLLVNAVKRALSMDCEVTVLTDPAKALKHLEEGARFDLVLCDLMMPGMSGMEVYAKVQEQIPEMARRFTFITGGAFTLRAAEFLASVENPMIEKPFSPESLRTFVQAFLRKAGTAS